MFFADLFEQDLPAGKVTGSPAGPQSRVIRKGIDREGVLSIDHGALRIQPLLKPGWGRAGLAYGPYGRQNGLGMAVLFLNGHNASESSDGMEPFRARIKRWVRGSEAQPILARMLKAARGRRRARFARLARRWWAWTRPQGLYRTCENLSSGWFPTETITNPLLAGSAMTIHSKGPENSELWASAAGNQIPAISRLQDLPLYFLVVLREKGAAYYAASIAGAAGLPAFPLLRPLAIDPFDQTPTVYAGVHQSVMGQIGFHVDSRVYGFQVDRFEGFETWYGSAQCADPLDSNRPGGSGRLDQSYPGAVGSWQQLRGSFERAGSGARPAGEENLAVMRAPEPSGLVHVLIPADVSSEQAAGLVWRCQDADNYWSVQLDSSGARLVLCLDGRQEVLAEGPTAHSQAGTSRSLQVSDDGTEFAVCLDGRLLFDRRFQDDRLCQAAGVGLWAECPGAAPLFRDFEAHPRAVRAPANLRLPLAWQPPAGDAFCRDDFSDASGPLEGRLLPGTGLAWQRTAGRGNIALTRHGAAVLASPENPNPGRTLYTIDWPDQAFAELDIPVTPPGTARGQGHRGRAGLVFWQDPDNYITVSTWLDDIYQGASLSSFFHLDGYEELYDAVWTNVGSRIYWGKDYNLRVAFDGLNYLVYLDDEPMLYRSLQDVYPHIRRLAIRRVGIAANWEWGNDTGSIFRSFNAKKRLKDDR